MEKSGDKESTNGLIRVNIQVSGLIIISKAKENTGGLMAGYIREVGKRISYMEEVFILGLMDECIKAGFIMVNSTVKVFINKQMDKRSMVSGKKAKKV